MALVVNGDITPEAVIERFQAAVVDNILNGVYHAGNPPMCRGYQCVPIQYMDHVNNVNKTPNIGSDGNIINATTLLDGLISITRDLTRVGTFAFTVWMKHSTSGVDSSGNTVPSSTSTEQIDSASGKVLFTKDYIRSNFSNPADIVGTEYGQTIKADSLNQLLYNIFNHWSTTSRHSYSGRAEVCHVVCHNNCHYNCHSNCHSECHGWTLIKDNGLLK